MLSMFTVPLKTEVGYGLDECGKQPTCYVYLDDGLFTGNRILADLRDWLKTEAPNEAIIHVIVMALHRGGQYYAQTNLAKVEKETRKKITFHWWRIIELEDRKNHTYDSDVLRPTRIPDDAQTQADAKALKFPPVLRTPGKLGPLKIFSSDEARDLLEQQLLIKGSYIREVCPKLKGPQRPLGNMLLETLGFGSTIVAFRNCPNNTPLAFWAGDPWYPLFPRKTN
jgi:hypothetical protein